MDENRYVYMKIKDPPEEDVEVEESVEVKEVEEESVEEVEEEVQEVEEVKSCTKKQESVKVQETSKKEECCNKPISLIGQYHTTAITIIFVVTILIDILFFVSFLVGTYSTWYSNIKQDNINPWIPRISWIVVTLISYVATYILWKNINPDNVVVISKVSIFYLVNALLILLWSVAFYQLQNIAAGFWMSLILLLYNFWLMIYIWYINPLASIFIFPLVAMYFYFMYSTLHLAWINNVPI